MNSTKYWIATISKEHTLRGVAGGFMQVCHGKQAPLKVLDCFVSLGQFKIYLANSF